MRRLKHIYCTAITKELKSTIKNKFSNLIINEKREKAWSKIADSTPSGKFDRIWEISCQPFEFFPKKFKDPNESTENDADKYSNDEFTEEDPENASKSDFEYEPSETGSEQSDFEYESESEIESDIDSDCEKF